MPYSKENRFGQLDPKYSFVLNPYWHQRVSRCPFCDQRTGQRKLPLVIHVDPDHFIALNYTSRYCSTCDLLIAHKHEIERLLKKLFEQLNRSVIGNPYLILGTLEKKVWREGLVGPKYLYEARAQMHDFKTYYEELRMTQPGWYGPNEKPPIMKPSKSEDWIKA